MTKTYGLTHINLNVRDVKKSRQFYENVLGMKERSREGPKFIFLSTPGSRDLVSLWERKDGKAGKMGGVSHFGFRLKEVAEMDRLLRLVERHGGKLIRRGERGPRETYAFVKDPDGYMIEIWRD